MAAHERGGELADWSGKLRRPLSEQHLRRQGSYSFYALMVARAFAKAQSSGEETHAFLSALMRKASVPFGPTAQQRRSIDTITALVFGGLPDDAGAREALADLLDARLGPDFGVIRQVIDLFQSRLGDERLLQYLNTDAVRPEATFARLHLSARRGQADPVLLEQARDTFAAAPSVTRFYFAEAVARLLFEGRDLRAAWDWTEAAMPLAPHSFHAAGFWRLRGRLAEARGNRCAAEQAASTLAALRAAMD